MTNRGISPIGQGVHPFAGDNPMNARAESRYIRVLQSTYIEGQHIAEVECNDFDFYMGLPSVLEFQGRLFGKTGWNSDTGKACYKTGVPMASFR